MKKIISAVLAILSLAVLPLRAEEKAAKEAPQDSASFSWDSIRTRLTHLKEGLMSSANERRYQHRSVAAVAAVRGAEQKIDDPNKPYVKNSSDEKKLKTLRAERAEFSAAVDLLLAGKTEEGKKKLADFEANHPKSSLLKDVRDTRAMIDKAPAADAADKSSDKEQSKP